MRQILRHNLILLFLLAVLTPLQALAMDQPVASDSSRQELLDLQGYLLWQRLNQARSNPLAVVTRLGIPLEQARAALGDDAWLLDSGLPPLAWNTQLVSSASGHGRDMFARLYYSYVTPEGLGVMERVAATGYQAAFENETLAALFFGAYVDVALAVDFMVDTMLRDELTGVAGVRRNIFSPEPTEVGAAFFAETVPVLAANPYVYLFVVDFAAPLVPRSFLVGVADCATQVMSQSYYTGMWDVLPALPGGGFQGPLPTGGVEVYAWDATGALITVVPIYDDQAGRNRYVELGCPVSGQ